MIPAQVAIKSTTQDFVGIEDIKDDLVILKDGSCCLILKVTAINFGLLSEQEQDAIIYAYAGMLNWEGDMAKNLQVIFRLPNNEAGGTAVVGQNLATNTKFQDAVIINKDVRLIKNQGGEIILLYAIIDKETIIITVNDTAFKEIIDRLNKEKGLKR